MFWKLQIARLTTRLAQFRDDVRGTIMVETVITLPLLFWMLWATFEFFEIHRYQSVRDKATYTIADMLSREQLPVNQIYITNSMSLFDQITNDTGVNQIRVSVVQFSASDNQYNTIWSQVRGNGSLSEYGTGEFPDGSNTLPILSDGEQVILVESESTYEPMLDLVFDDEIPITTRVFTSLRFSPSLNCADC